MDPFSVPTSSDNVITIGCHFKEGQAFVVVLEQTTGFPIDMAPIHSFDDLGVRILSAIRKVPDVIHGILVHGPRSEEIRDHFEGKGAFKNMSICVRPYWVNLSICG